jgi:hypothetical protein
MFKKHDSLIIFLSYNAICESGNSQSPHYLVQLSHILHESTVPSSNTSLTPVLQS